MSFTVLSFILSILVKTLLAQELLKNADFENSQSISPWICNGCKVVVTHNSYHGNSGVFVSNRLHNWGGISQTISVQGGQSYKCSAFFKILGTAPGKMFANIHMMVSYKTTDGKTHYNGFYNDKYHQSAVDWEEMGGDFTLPQGVNSIKVYVQIDDASVNYLFDKASCQMIHKDPNWKTKASQRIEQTRKGSLNIRIASDGHVDTSGLSVQIKQMKSKFGFGTAVRADHVTSTAQKAYQDFLYNNFEWAVIENALKWKQMEWSIGHVNYNKGIDAVKTLRSHNMKVRGHNLFWSVESHSPKWLSGLSSTELLKEMHKRVDGTLSHTKGMLEHWDVNNENLHGDFFELHTGNANISYDMYNWVHQSDPNVKLFLNEFNVISSSVSTTAYSSQGKRYKLSKVPVYGLGVQGHLHNSHINIDVLKYRLDKVAEAGLPIWITELTIMDTNNTAKAAALDDVMTLFFSHPAVEGVLLWGFWDGAAYDRRIAIATGSNVTPNAAGRKWQELYHQRFRTNESHSFNGGTSVNTNIYFGEHQLTVKQHGKTIHTENITLEHGGQTATVNIHGTGQNVHVTNVAFG